MCYFQVFGYTGIGRLYFVTRHIKDTEAGEIPNNKTPFFAMAKYRSAITGQYVKPGYAKTHPNTTVKEKK